MKKIWFYMCKDNQKLNWMNFMQSECNIKQNYESTAVLFYFNKIKFCFFREWRDRMVALMVWRKPKKKFLRKIIEIRWVERTTKTKLLKMFVNFNQVLQLLWISISHLQRRVSIPIFNWEMLRNCTFLSNIYRFNRFLIVTLTN